MPVGRGFLSAIAANRENFTGHHAGQGAIQPQLVSRILHNLTKNLQLS
jgi:hypothetical protein